MEDKVEREDRCSLLGYVKGCSILINSLSLCHMRSYSGHCMWSQSDTWSWHLGFHPYLFHPSPCLLQRLSTCIQRCLLCTLQALQKEPRTLWMWAPLLSA